jgi:cardiolipin synthase
MSAPGPQSTPPTDSDVLARFKRRRRVIWSIVLIGAHLIGLLTSMHAAMSTRTAQGAIAWVVSLNTFPYLAVPAYWVLGRRNFAGTVEARADHEEEIQRIAQSKSSQIDPYRVTDYADLGDYRALMELAGRHLTSDNAVELLIDDAVATVGTANFDNRSFRLNFEVTAVVVDRDFAAEVEEMLVADFDRSVEVPKNQLEERGFWFTLAVRLARLTAPIQ